jgi:hypothetical protein
VNWVEKENVRDGNLSKIVLTAIGVSPLESGHHDCHLVGNPYCSGDSAVREVEALALVW